MEVKNEITNFNTVVLQDGCELLQILDRGAQWDGGGQL